MAALLSGHQDRLIHLAGSVGEGGFHAALLNLIEGLVPGDNAQVMSYPIVGRPAYLVSHDTTDDSERLYMDYFYRFDPYYRLLRGTSDFGVRRDSDIRPKGYDEGGYYSRFFPMTGVDDYLSLALPAHELASDGHTGVFVGRRKGFAAREQKIMERLLPACLRLGLAHGHRLERGAALPCALYQDGAEIFANAAWRGLQDSGVTDLAWYWQAPESARPRLLLYPSGRLFVDLYAPEAADLRLVTFLPEGDDAARFLHARLTPRERQIVRLILAGHDNAGIALQLGIGEGTLRNHRKRLHKKLGVHAERDLFRLAFTHLAQTGA